MYICKYRYLSQYWRKDDEKKGNEESWIQVT